MKRKLLALLTAVLLLAAMATPAFADVIWVPDNRFYSNHSHQCVQYSRGFLVNGEGGSTMLLASPNSTEQVAAAENGTVFYASHIWTDGDGVRWAIGHPDGDWGTEGWVLLTDLALIYTDKEFEEDHGHEFLEYDGSGDHLTEVCIYSYPGGQFSHVLAADKAGKPFSESFTKLYTDENGLHWTYIDYFMGKYNAWVCIDDPMNENLGSDTLLTVGQVRGVSETQFPSPEETPAAGTWPIWAVPAVLIVAAAAVTGAIMGWRKKAAAG